MLVLRRLPIVRTDSLRQEIIEGEVHLSAVRERVRVLCVPIRRDGNVIGIITRESAPSIGRQHGELERTYLDIFNRFARIGDNAAGGDHLPDLQERPDRRWTPVDVLGWVRGRAVDPERLAEHHRERRVVHRTLGIAEDRGRDGLADIDVETGPVALAVRVAEPSQSGAHAAVQLTAVLDRLDGALRGSREHSSGHSDHRPCGEKGLQPH
jgi:hypothetical protein